MFSRLDLNQDQFFDQDELKAMEERFRQRRAGSREAARDPIVYGVAAAGDAFLIRTGTLVFCIRQDSDGGSEPAADTGAE